MAVKSYLPRPSCSIESDGGTRVRNDFKIKNCGFSDIVQKGGQEKGKI